MACSTDVSTSSSPQCHMAGSSLAIAWRSHAFILSNSSCRPTTSDTTLAILVVVQSPHTTSTGWRKVLLAARTQQVMLCAARLCTSTGQTCTGTVSGQTEAKRGCWTAHFQPGSAAESPPDAGQQRWTRCWWVRRDSWWVLLPCGEAVTLYTVKEMSKKSRERRGCRGLKAPSGEEAEVNGCSCGRGGSCMFTEPAFTLQSFELTPR